MCNSVVKQLAKCLNFLLLDWEVQSSDSKMADDIHPNHLLALLLGGYLLEGSTDSIKQNLLASNANTDFRAEAAVAKYAECPFLPSQVCLDKKEKTQFDWTSDWPTRSCPGETYENEAAFPGINWRGAFSALYVIPAEELWVLLRGPILEKLGAERPKILFLLHPTVWVKNSTEFGETEDYLDQHLPVGYRYQLSEEPTSVLAGMFVLALYDCGHNSGTNSNLTGDERGNDSGGDELLVEGFVNDTLAFNLTYAQRVFGV